jgi:hypothetical protein
MTTTPPMMKAAKEEAAAEHRAVAGAADGDEPSRVDATNAILTAIAGVAKDVRELGDRIDDHDDELRSIRRALHGSKSPPTTTSDPSTPIAVMAQRGSAASFDVEELRGELLSMRTELARQSSAMGLGKRGAAWLASAEGRRSIVGLLTLAGAAYAALHASLH